MARPCGMVVRQSVVSGFGRRVWGPRERGVSHAILSGDAAGAGARDRFHAPCDVWCDGGLSMKTGPDRILYAVTIGGSSALLFLVQPILAKSILPRFGGAAGVWVASMLFFQVMLLVGYLYAYGITRHLGQHMQAAVHLVLLAASLLVLPLRAGAEGVASGSGPTWAILQLLTASAGLPYFLL